MTTRKTLTAILIAAAIAFSGFDYGFDQDTSARPVEVLAQKDSSR